MLAGGGIALAGARLAAARRDCRAAHLAESPLTCVAGGFGPLAQEFRLSPLQSTSRNLRRRSRASPQFALLNRPRHCTLSRTLRKVTICVLQDGPASRAVLLLLVVLPCGSYHLLRQGPERPAHAVARGLPDGRLADLTARTKRLSPVRDLFCGNHDTFHAKSQRNRCASRSTNCASTGVPIVRKTDLSPASGASTTSIS